MEQDPFSLFIDLISFDKTIFSTEDKVISLKKEVSTLENEIKNLQSGLESSKNQFLAAVKEVNDKELKMQEADQLEKSKRQKLEQIENPKEYTALKKEIDRIKQIQYELEPQLVESWNKSEAAKKEYETKKNEIENKISEIEKNIKEKKGNTETLDQEIKKLYLERAQKEKNVPEEWVSKYNIMRSRVTNPVVPVTEGGSCSACFYHITSQDLINLKHKKLLQCKRCYRFLYLEK